MQEHGVQRDHVEPAGVRAEVIDRPAQGRGLRAQALAQQPPAVLQPAQMVAPLREHGLEVRPGEGHEVPRVVRPEVEHSQRRPLPLHPEAQVARRRPDLEHRPALQSDPAEIGRLRAAQVPLARDDAVPGDVDGVVEIAVAHRQAAADFSSADLRRLGAHGPPD